VKYPCLKFVDEHVPGRIGATYSVKRSLRHYYSTPRWPPEDWYIPGGVIDCSGRMFEVKRLVGWAPCPRYLKHLDLFLGGLPFKLLRKRGFGIEFFNPQHLSLAEMQSRVSFFIFGDDTETLRPGGSKAKLRAGAMRQLFACKSFSSVIEFVDWYQRTDGGRVV
jgi:hypothetical protein